MGKATYIFSALSLCVCRQLKGIRCAAPKFCLDGRPHHHAVQGILQKNLQSAGRPNCRGVVVELNSFSVMHSVPFCKLFVNMLTMTPLSHVEEVISSGDLRCLATFFPPLCLKLTVVVHINFYFHCGHSDRCVKSFYTAVSIKTVKYLGTWQTSEGIKKEILACKNNS